MWSLKDSQGNPRDLHLPCHHIPRLKQRLLSTTVFSKAHPDSTITVNNNHWTVKKKGEAIDVFINPRNNLPTSTCYRKKAVHEAAASLGESITHHCNFNLSEPQKELLRWHQRLGHVSLKTVQFILRTGALAKSDSMRRLHSAASKIQTNDLPKCSSCQFGKQTNRAKPGRKLEVVKDRSGITSANKLHPGELVFIDHFVSTTRGRKIKGFGIKGGSSNTSSSHKGGLIFVDAAAGWINIQFQSHLNSHETISAVDSFEALARDDGVVIKGCQSDNGSAFTSNNFKARLAANQQFSQLAPP